MKKVLILVVFILLFVVGCQKNEKMELIEDETLVMTKTNSDELTSKIYMKNEKKEEKLAGNFIKDEDMYYLNGENKCLYVDENRNLQLVSQNGEKEKICSDVANRDYIFDEENYYGNMADSSDDLAPNGFGVSKDGKTIIYMNYDGNLYVKKVEGGESEKIASEVTAFEISDNGQYVYYIKNGYDLYVYSNEENEKISSDATQFKISDTGKYIIWTNSDSELYMRNLDLEDKEKISSDGADFYNLVISDEGKIIYTADGELYIYENEEKEKLASDVMNFCKNDKKIYYINNEQNLYELSLEKNNEKQKIRTGIMDFKIADSTLYFTDEDLNIYKLKDNNDIEKVGNDLFGVTFYNVVDGNLVYMKSDNSIYLNDEKVVSNSKGFAFNSVCFAYVNDKNEVHIYDFKDEKDSVKVKNAKKYSTIYLGNKILYSNQLEPEELQGYWKYIYDDAAYQVLEFSGENKINIYSYYGDKVEFDYEVNFSDENSMNITLEENEDTDTIEIDETGENLTIEENGEYFYYEKITEKEFNSLIGDSYEESSDI